MNLIPKNWAEFQHYRDRKPAWIKLHRGLLDDYNFACLPVASRALAPMLWLLASEYTDGCITASLGELAYRMHMSDAELASALNPLVENGFFSSGSELLAPRKQAAIPEKEKEKEKEKEADSSALARATAAMINGAVFEQFWKAYPAREGANPKEPARQKFIALIKSGVNADGIIAGAKAYAAECQRNRQVGTRFVARAITWLNESRWEDYRPKPAATPVDEGPVDPNWKPIRDALVAELGRDMVNAWFKGVTVARVDERIEIAAPTKFTMTQWDNKFRRSIERAVKVAYPECVEFNLTLQTNGRADIAAKEPFTEPREDAA